MIAVRTMNGAVRNKYRSSTGKTAAWLSSSHIKSKPRTEEIVPPTT